MSLPITVSGVTVSSADSFILNIKSTTNGDTLVSKTFNNITGNTIEISLTQADTALLTPGKHAYSLDWYQSGAFLCNIIPDSVFRVVDKA